MTKTNQKRNGMLHIEDLVINPTPRIPICLCLDVSGSMGRAVGGTPTGREEFMDGQIWSIVRGGKSCISDMQQGIEKFLQAVRDDDIARYSAEIAVVTFGDSAECIQGFAPLEQQGPLPTLKARGNTAMGEGVNLALDLLEERKKEYRKKGIDYFQPWLVLMTDGSPNGDETALSNAISRTREAVKARKLTVFPLGIGSEADLDSLDRFSPGRKAFRMDGLRFEEFFAWLGRSVALTSKSAPGDNIVQDTEELKKLGLPQAVEDSWRNV